MIVRWTEGLACDVPAWAEDKEVRKWDARLLRFSGENTEDGGVDMVFRDAANVDEFFQGIFVRNIACEDIRRLGQERVSTHEYSLSMPCNNVKRCVLLCTFVKLSTYPVTNHLLYRRKSFRINNLTCKRLHDL